MLGRSEGRAIGRSDGAGGRTVARTVGVGRDNAAARRLPNKLPAVHPAPTLGALVASGAETRYKLEHVFLIWAKFGKILASIWNMSTKH